MEGREGGGGESKGRGGGRILSSGAVQEDRVKRVLGKNKIRLKEIVENLDVEGDSSLQDVVRVLPCVAFPCLRGWE